MIVAVTGGRNLKDSQLVNAALAKLHTEAKITLLVHGACPSGADKLATKFAEANGIPHTGNKYAADWKSHCKAAGPIRNRLMLETERPSALLAFPGGRGTEDCVRKAKNLGIRVIRVEGNRE